MARHKRVTTWRLAVVAWPRSVRIGALVAALALVALGVTAIVAGSRSQSAAAAPLPTSQFSDATLPPLAPGDTLPTTSAAPVARDAAPATGGSAASSSSAPWTFAGANRLFVQSLGVNAPWTDEGISGGGLVIPSDVKVVGRWTGGAAVDATTGTVLLAGHVNYIGQGNGALYKLAQTKPGAVVVVNDAAGQHTTWRVQSLQVVQKNALPSSIFAPTGARQLVIVTCGGPIMKVADGHGGTYNTYRDNVIVTAVPA